MKTFYFIAEFPQYLKANHLEHQSLLISLPQYIIHCALRCISNIFDNKLSTYELTYQLYRDPVPIENTMSIFILHKIRSAKDLTTISTVMFSTVKHMKFFITFEAVCDILVFNPFIFCTKRSFDNFSHLIIHLQQYIPRQNITN